MDRIWIIEGRFLQAICLLLVISLSIVVFAWLVRAIQRKFQKEEEPEETPHSKQYTDDDFVGLE